VAGLPNVSSQWAGEPNKLTFMHCFYSQHVGAMHVENISTSSSSASYTYVTMWKAGSSFIHQNLGASFNSSQVIGVRHPQTKGAVHGTVFTFAREPLSRFFSGATEVAWRTRLDGCTQRAATSKRPTRKQTAQEWRARVGDMAVSMARNTNQSCVWRSSGAEVDVLPPPRYAEQLLQAILNVDSDWAGFKVSHIAHLLPQVGAVNGGGWPLQFIGHTEQFAEDWASLRGRVPGACHGSRTSTGRLVCTRRPTTRWALRRRSWPYCSNSRAYATRSAACCSPTTSASVMMSLNASRRSKNGGDSCRAVLISKSNGDNTVEKAPTGC